MLQVKVIVGDEREVCGKMMMQEGTDAVFKPENSDQVRQVPLNYLCKLVPSAR